MFGRMRRAGISATMLGIASLAFFAWVHAHVLVMAVHVDEPTVRNALVVADDPKVRGALGDWLGTAVDLVGGQPELRQLVLAITSGPPLQGATADALTTALLDTRDGVLGQLDRAPGEPTHAVDVPISALLAAFGVDLPPDVLDQLGAADPEGVSLPVISADQVSTLLWQYTLADLVDRWALVVAGVAGLIGLVASRRPLRDLAIVFGIAAAVCWVAPLVISGIQSWASGETSGSWGALVSPLLAAAASQVQPLLLPAALLTTGGTVAFAVAAVLVERRGQADAEPS